MYDVCNEVRKAFSLDWDDWVTYSSDNTSSMTGQDNNLLQKIRIAEDDQKTFDVGYPCHLAYLSTGKGDKELFVNVENFFIGI